MDDSQEDQRAPHRQRPNRAVSLEQLRRLGVVYRRVGQWVPRVRQGSSGEPRGRAGPGGERLAGPPAAGEAVGAGAGGRHPLAL